jgi:hypothetical protein
LNSNESALLIFLMPHCGSKKVSVGNCLFFAGAFVYHYPQSHQPEVLIGSCLPDAVYTAQATGEMILFEADAGNYSKQQIQQKTLSWHRRGLKQTWAQPKNVTIRVMG